jgi:site-specific DNA-methyltransferase (adenine-specific)
MKLTDKLTITNEDNMELMARYPDNYFDLAIVDPPYGIDLANMNMGIGNTPKASKAKNRKWKSKDWDNDIPSDDYFKELFRVSKNQIIWGGNYFNLGICNKFIIWDKEIPDGLSFSDCEYAWTSFSGANKIFRYSAYLNKSEKFHPTQKPPQLYKWLLDKYAKEMKCTNCGGCGEYSYLIGSDCDYRQCQECKGKGTIKPKILDTHLGSGSIAIACHDYGFDLTACELDQEYYDKAIERIKNHVSQQKLF